MKTELVSVVVPIYNVERYLNRCVESIINQTYTNLEIILVDDGSTDKCPEICEEWRSKDSRIKVIHKENAGLGMARNTGIENAKGDYICFFDSDDYIESKTIETAMLEAKKTNADVVAFGLSDVDENGNIVRSVIPKPFKMSYSGDEVQEDLLPDMIFAAGLDLMLSACIMLFSMQMIKESYWRFVSERTIIAEDVYSLINLFSGIKTMSFVPESLYNYCKNEGSLTHTYRKDRYEKIKLYYDECMKMCKRHAYNDKVLTRIGLTYFSFTIAAMKQIVMSNIRFREKFKAIYDIVNDKHLHNVISYADLEKETKARRVLIAMMKNKCSVACFGLIVAVCIKNGEW